MQDESNSQKTSPKVIGLNTYLLEKVPVFLCNDESILIICTQSSLCMAHQKGYNSSPNTSTFMHAIKQGPDITKRGDICYHPRHILKDKILFSNIA